MSMWWSSNSVGLLFVVVTGLRAMQFKAVALTSPSSLRRARRRFGQLITMVAGH